MKATPYLFFNGNCADAMRFYERILGGKLEALMTYGESQQAEVPIKSGSDRIMHASLMLPDGSRIMASDDMSGEPYRGMSGFGVAIDASSNEDAKRIFDAFSEGGQVWMPMQKTFWAETFGMTADRFGVGWLISGVEIARS
jgi:PhnB protein